MPFTFHADPMAIVKERTAQFVSLGIPASVISDVSTRLNDLWENRSGGWPYEWSCAARAFETRGDFLLSSLLYGVAKYPCLGNSAHAEAYHLQLENYIRAAANFSQRFERRLLSVSYRQDTTKVAIHLLSEQGLDTAAPVVLMLGGVDTWKMDIHNSAAQVSKILGAHIALLDMPGVGESEVPNAPDGDAILDGVVRQLRPIGNGRIGILAFSFGGLWAVKLALTGRVDAAAAIGAGISSSFERDNLSRIPNGMPGIFGNSLFRDAPFSSLDDFAGAMAPFSLREQGLYDWNRSTVPLLLVNGKEDPYIPRDDVTDFRARPNTVTRLVDGATHCAAEQMHSLMPWIIRWLKENLHIL